jgi:hypothetical protein
LKHHIDSSSNEFLVGRSVSPSILINNIIYTFFERLH